MIAKLEVIAALSVLAHPVRLEVFRTLVVAGHGGRTPTALSEALDAQTPATDDEPVVKQSTLSTYLKELVAAGLVQSERQGRNVVYRADYQRMDGVIGFLTENCCKGVPAAETAGSSSCCG